MVRRSSPWVVAVVLGVILLSAARCGPEEDLEPTPADPVTATASASAPPSDPVNPDPNEPQPTQNPENPDPNEPQPTPDPGNPDPQEPQPPPPDPSGSSETSPP
jgi:hypothetical protein